uniref:Cytochrome b n=1 Tax=Hydatigera parva TaxID=1434711 RepID=N0DLF7_9CEST|nr:cytochrome b [Hydatigera parva]BAN15655.1 cytochrome b [Hydatigera parva]
MISVLRKNLVDLPISYSLNYFWSNGFVLSMFVVFQIISGIFLSFLYISDSVITFFTVTSFSNDEFFTWCLRYWHMVGVNILFILLFVHMCRSLYYGSYSNVAVWNVGFVLYLIMMIEAFTGYILPWHQMSYWAATVLTSIISSLPGFGSIVYEYVVGGFSISGETLARVFSIHVCLGFLMLGVIIVHMQYLHSSGSSNPLYFFNMHSDIIYFHSYFTVKDLFLLMIILTGVLSWLFLCPDLMVDIESYIEADQLSTPVSIKPEWYFLSFYAILRCIGSKIGGLVLIISFLFFLWVPTSGECSVYSLCRQFNFWLIVSLFLSLIYYGTCHPEYPYLTICQICSGLMLFLMLLFKL